MDYQSLQSAARRLIAENGRAITLRQKITSGEAWNPTQTDSDTEVFAVFGRFESSQVNGESIKSTDLKVTVDADFQPTTDMKLIDDGTEYKIVNVFPTKPGPTVIKYDIQARI